MARKASNLVPQQQLWALRAALMAARRRIGGGLDGHRLRGGLLAIARGTWLAVAALVCALYLASTWIWAGQVRASCPPEICVQGQVPVVVGRALAALHLSVSVYGWYSLGLNMLFAVGFATTAGLIFWRRSSDPLALYLSLSLLIFGTLTPFASGLLSRLEDANPGWRLPVELLQFVGASTFGIVGFVFPDGRFVPRWTRVAALAVVLWFLPAYLWPESPFSFTAWPMLAFICAFVCFFAAACAAQIYRYRRVSTPAQRQQTKWVVFGILGAAAGYLTGVFDLHLIVTPTLTSPRAVISALAGGTLIYLSLLLIPICIGIAILRFHLFDIDVIIRRTVIYTVLTGLLALIYAGSIFGAQGVVQAIWGRQALPAGVVVASTLLIATLFQPLRRGVQRTIDRRFYRHKYDAARTMAAFAGTLRRDVDLNQLTGHLLAVVDETMQPSQVSLWLVRPGERSLQIEPGARNDAEPNG